MTTSPPTTNKYGLKLIPKLEKVKPKTIQSLDDADVDILKIAEEMMEEHKEVLAALAKR